MRKLLPLVLIAGLAIVPQPGGGAPEPCTRFVTPATASAGEWIPVLAYRHHDRKGPLEIRFDDRPAAWRLTRYAAFTTPGVTELFLTVGVPSAATRGRHLIQLYEPGTPPVPIATATIQVGTPFT